MLLSIREILHLHFNAVICSYQDFPSVILFSTPASGYPTYTHSDNDSMY
jgi:hypothetical protein